MSFMDRLKKTFLYTGGAEDNSEPERREERVQEEKPKPRLDIGNPMQRIRDIKDTTVNAFKNSQPSSKQVLSDYTKSLVYEAYHNVVESRIGKGKPLVEAKLLYKRFLEEQVTDEAMYTDVDLEYIKALVKYIRELKSIRISNGVNRDSIADDIANHAYFLNIVEVLDVQHGYAMMKYFCEVSYVICGFSYKGKGTNILSTKVPHFYMNINDSTFVLLNEVKTLVSDDSPLEDKKSYIIDKVSPLFLRYVILNDIPDELLYSILTTFNNLTEGTTTPSKEVWTTRSNHDGAVTIVGEVTEPELSEEEIQARMFAGIQNDINPITTLRRESKFSNIYSELADPRNPNVTLEDLEDAVEEINKMLESEDFELSPSEFKIFSTIKGRLKMMKGGM